MVGFYNAKNNGTGPKIFRLEKNTRPVTRETGPSEKLPVWDTEAGVNLAYFCNVFRGVTQGTKHGQESALQ